MPNHYAHQKPIFDTAGEVALEHSFHMTHQNTAAVLLVVKDEFIFSQYM